MTQQEQARPAGRARRADAERTVQAILEAAERVLSADPTASMEQIAAAAGVARTTVHRRFATRDALIDELTGWAAQRFAEAVRRARPETAPPLVALYQVTANVLDVKIGWGFAMSRAFSADPQVAGVHAGVREQCDRLFLRARDAGVIRTDVDLDWARRVYYALIHEATQQPEPTDPTDTDALATLVVDTLLRGIGANGGL
ncbi:TetR/AcrR family transcriptional regulator [Amycolatopsis rhizosphaerae]|uniref:TetR/AcrR family transcriptional regulator n=1 Tax=Amycolatopsis rhizosphaerae TaxID=2053003 RepID=A0A558BL32_9PSEU|nr:TetR/AcrR family transcriptional regulator [Amycolatopsis rhizosphaerae]TVT37212.1 TetR/AcrR family transcriptional regulator [Amycolatopsis rhizosphaerae]